MSHATAPPQRRSTRAAGITGLAGASALALITSTTPTVASAAPVEAQSGPAVRADAVVAVDDGGTARLRLTLVDAADGAPVTVTWATGRGTASAGKDYRAGKGTITFAAGTAAGASRSIRIATRETAGAEMAETIPVALTVSGGHLQSRQPTVVINAHDMPYLDAGLPVEKRVRDLLSRMTLEEKVGQMTQAERGAIDSERHLITEWKLGSILSGGGSTPKENTPEAWADMVDAYQSYARLNRLQIPLIYGVDSVHGHGNLYGATLIPHNVGLGSTRDPDLVERAQHMVATETRATGIPWIFGPCLCVARDDRWGRTYESFGEHPALVTAMETSIDGFQGEGIETIKHKTRVLATAKHFAGDGDTEYGSAANPDGTGYQIDQGVTRESRAHFERIDLAPYIPAVQKHDVGSVMPSFSSVDFTDDGLGNPLKMHAHEELMQGWLKDKVGFDGFIISDWDGLDQIALETKEEKVAAYINAGGDMAMEPFDYQDFEKALLSEVKAGRVPMSRINDAVSRILTKKFQVGLFEKPFAERTYADRIGSAEHRALAREAVAKSQVLLKNSDDVLPLRPDAKLYVAGRNADDLGNQAGGWTITWQGQSGEHTEGTTVLEGLQQVAPGADITYSKDASAAMAGDEVGVVVVGETPYSEGFGDVGGPQWAYDPSDNGVPREPKKMELQEQDQAVVDKVCAALEKCVVVVVSGRPQVVGDRLADIDALVASWLPGTEGTGVADVLFGAKPFTGQLPLSWPRNADQEPINVGDRDYRPLYPFGWGLRTMADGSASAQSGTDLRRAATLVADGTAQGGEPELITMLRTYVQDQVADPRTGVPAKAADHIARADVATLKGNYRRAAKLLLEVAQF